MKEVVLLGIVHTVLLIIKNVVILIMKEVVLLVRFASFNDDSNLS